MKCYFEFVIRVCRVKSVYKTSIFAQVKSCRDSQENWLQSNKELDSWKIYASLKICFLNSCSGQLLSKSDFNQIVSKQTLRVPAIAQWVT